MRPLPLVLLLAACTPDGDGLLVLPPDAPLPLDPAIEARVDAALAAMTLEQKVAQLSGTTLMPTERGYPTPGVPALGVPGFHMSDGPRGCTMGVSTSFPVGMARAASWDPELERRVGEAIGAECAAKGVDVILAPAMNLVSHPLYGRAQENYGEDPRLTGRMAVAFTQGAQEHLLASAKHYAANNIEDTRFDVDVTLDPRTLREVYLPHFREVVREGGVGSVMAAYNQVNGAYCTQNRPLLTDILRGDWGFQGFVESDWVQATHDAKAALEAGLDLEMPTPLVFSMVLPLVQAGQIAEATIDEAVRRLVRQQLVFGLDDPSPPPLDVVASAEHVGLAREVAAAGTVLLKNEGGALPFEDGAATFALVGTLIDRENTGDVGSSNVTPPYVVTPREGLVAAVGDARVVAVPTDTPDAGELAAIAAADVAVVVVGLDAADEGENIPGRPGGDREELGLDATQVALIEAVAAAHDQVVVVLVGGSAITVEGWVDDVEVVLQSWYAGLEGGSALADVLTGVAYPGGRLPLSVPTGLDQLPPFDATSFAVTYPYLHGYRHLDREGLAPRFPFGFGLSTTTFELGEVQDVIDGPTPTATQPWVLRVPVTNTGARGGAEVVQLYVGPEDATLGLPDRVLADFGKIALAPGESGVVELEVRQDQLATWDEGRHAFVVTPGAWTAWIGTSSRDLPIEIPFQAIPTGGK